MDTKKTQVLIVEDTMTQALMLQHLLEQHEFETSLARTPAKALALLADGASPDVILSDVSMPDMDGYQLCAQVKADPKCQHIPFVLLSSFNEPEDIISIIKSGADSFILKRFDEKYFLGRLRDILSTVGRRRGTTQTNDAQNNICVFNGAEHNISGTQMQLTDMVLSAFATSMHLLPLVREE